MNSKIKCPYCNEVITKYYREEKTNNIYLHDMIKDTDDIVDVNDEEVTEIICYHCKQSLPKHITQELLDLAWSN